ncbi:MAG: TolC family protein [Deltaproteobacteria bacterium]|nr:TolC family protein [Deltaproteobacteria bacterium]
MERIAAGRGLLYNRPAVQRRPLRLLTLSAVVFATALPLAAFADDPVAAPTEGEGGADGEPATATPTEPEAPLMDLAAFTRAADRSYPGMRAADARIRAAQAQLDEIWVSPFFQGQVTAGFTFAPEQSGSPIFSPDSQVPVENPWQPVLQFGIEGVIPLWTFGKLGAAREAGRAGVRAAEADRQRVRQQLMYDVRRAYFALQLSLDLGQMMHETLPRIREALENVEDQIAEGDPDVDETDRYRLAAALAEIEARGAQIVHLEASSRAVLRLLTGVRRFRVPECPITRVDARLLPVEHYVDNALSERPEVRMLEAAVRARESSLDITRAGFLPDIGLAYLFRTSYAPGITDQTNPFVIDYANYMQIGAGLVMRWSIDLWGNAYRVDRESAHLDDVRARSLEARLGLEIEVTEAYNAAVEARDREVAYDRGRRETRSWFIAAAQGVELGTSELDDMVDAVRQYLTARYSHLQAIHDTNSAFANLERVSTVRVTERWEPVCD